MVCLTDSNFREYFPVARLKDNQEFLTLDLMTRIVKTVLFALRDLESVGLIHGNINDQTILISQKTGDVKLGLPEFLSGLFIVEFRKLLPLSAQTIAEDLLIFSYTLQKIDVFNRFSGLIEKIANCDNVDEAILLTTAH